MHTLNYDRHALVSLHTFVSLQAAHSLSYCYQGHQRSSWTTRLDIVALVQVLRTAVNYATGAIAVLQVGSRKHK